MLESLDAIKSMIELFSIGVIGIGMMYVGWNVYELIKWMRD